MPHVVVTDSDELVTGEAVLLDVQPVGLMMRALGALIDYVAYGLLFIGVSLTVGRISSELGASPSVLAITQIVLIVLCFVVVPITVEAVTRGRSIGKFAIGGRIVRADGGSITFRHAFIRGLVAVLEIVMTFGALAAIVGMFTPRAERIGDLMAGTFSTRTRTPKILETDITLPPALVPWSQVADVARLPVRLNRRIDQFLKNAANMMPHARERIAAELVADAAPYVTPMPNASPELALIGILVVRRDREYNALVLQQQHVNTLTAGT